MRRTAVIQFALLLAAAAQAARSPVILDRIAVIVGNRIIKTSDIDRDIRLTAFLNREKADFSPQAKKQSAERLIDQDLIRQEIANGNYKRPPESEATNLEAQLVRDRFGGSNAEFTKALARYGLTPEQLSTELLWQLTVLQFIEQRFRAGVFVSDSDVQKYEQEHQAELRAQNPGASADTLQAKARELLDGEQVNKNFADWLEQARKRTKIEYKPEAFS
jgi:peptidyl-prolyl cis-trans isomerase SurA